MTIETKYNIGDLVENNKQTCIGFISEIEIRVNRDNKTETIYRYKGELHSEEETCPYNVNSYYKEIGELNKKIEKIREKIRKSNYTDFDLLDELDILEERLVYLTE